MSPFRAPFLPAPPTRAPPMPVRSIPRTPYDAVKPPSLRRSMSPKPGKDDDVESENAYSDTEADEDHKETEKGSFNLDTRPVVRLCDWEQFKNRFQCTGEPSEFVVDTVEVLLKTHDLEENMAAEQLRRMPQEKRIKYTARLARPPLKVKTKTKASELPFDRIRINSSILLAHLAKISGNTSWSMLLPMTFLHPFVFFIHHQKSMKALLADLEVYLSSGTDATDQPDDVNDVSVADFGYNQPTMQWKALSAFMRTKKAMEQVRCYVEFVDKELMPYYRRFEQANHSKPMKIRFNDLWSLFRCGELVCTKHKLYGLEKGRGPPGESQYDDDVDVLKPPGDYSKPHKGAASEDQSVSDEGYNIVRLYSTNLPYRDWQGKGLGVGDQYEWDPRDTKFEVQFYRLDFDGTKYAPVVLPAGIRYFHGEEDIHKLPVFPIRFLKSKDSLMKDLREKGELFRRLISNAASGSKAMAYDGWSYKSLPPVFRQPGFSEYIER